MVAFETKIKKLLEEQGKTLVSLCNHIGVSDPGIRKMFKRGSCETSTLLKIADFFGVSPAYFFDNPEVSKDVSLCFETIQGGIGHGTGAEQMTKANAVGVMAVPGVPIGEGTPYIQVRGSSMVNRRDPAHSIPEGAWIGIQPSQSSVIRWGEVYAVMTTDGPVVKKLMPSEREGYITCVSFNEEDGYLPYELPTNEIIQPLYKVVAVITAQRWA